MYEILIFSTKKAFFLGSTLNVKAIWTSSDLPIGQKLHWFVKSCNVYDYDSKKKSDGHVTIIDNLCYAQVIEATPKTGSLVNADEYRFSYRSFSFRSDGSGSQMIECDIKFCLVDQCKGQISRDIDCDSSSPYQWKSGQDF